MSDSSKPARKPSYDMKSGTKSTGDYVAVNGGMPPKKDLDAINRENEPKSAPEAVGN